MGVINSQDVHNAYPDWDNVYIRKLEETNKKTFNPMERFNEKLKLLEKEDSNAIHYTVAEPPRKPTVYHDNLLKNLHKKINNLEQRVDEHNRRTKLNEEEIKRINDNKDSTVWDNTKSLVNDYIVEPVGKWHNETGKQFFDSSKKAIVEKVWDPISDFFRNL